jgi:nucleoside-diphosphate-sugar epimerase
VFADVEDDQALRACLLGVDAVVDLRSAVPHGNRAVLGTAWRDYARLRGKELGRVVDCALATGVGRVVRDTVTVVYADGGNRVLTETAPVGARGALAANLQAEEHVRRLTQAGGVGVALRMAPFYGPDDVISKELLQAADEGQARVVGDVQGWTSALHTDDVGPAVLAALAAPAGVYNVADSVPLRRGEWIGLLAASAGRSELRRPPRMLQRMVAAPVAALSRSHRVSAAAFTAATGWKPTVPDRREGWPAAAARLHGALR